MRLFSRISLASMLLLMPSAVSLRAETRTITDQFGRTVTAEVIAVEKDSVKIKTESGQIFSLSLATLSEADQADLRAWAKKQAPKPDTEAPSAKSLSLLLSRGKFGSKTLYRSAYYFHIHEQWGFSIQTTNTTLKKIDDVRVDYNIFADTYSDISSPTVQAGSNAIPSLEGKTPNVFRTKTAEVCKRKSSDSNTSGGELRGIWVRVYVGGKLLLEQSLPETLRTTEKWTAPTP